jgi:hypothetical protein
VTKIFKLEILSREKWKKNKKNSRKNVDNKNLKKKRRLLLTNEFQKIILITPT